MPTDYIEYMMRHTIGTYNDIRMKGIDKELLRKAIVKPHRTGITLMT